MSRIIDVHVIFTAYRYFFSPLTDFSGSVKDKNRTTTSKRSSAVSKKPSVSPAAGHRYRGRRSGRDQEGSRYDVGEGGGDWSNLPASNLPEDWGREKEVTEEKQTSTGNLINL